MFKFEFPQLKKSLNVQLYKFIVRIKTYESIIIISYNKTLYVAALVAIIWLILNVNVKPLNIVTTQK